jgi:hypothetical protein
MYENKSALGFAGQKVAFNRPQLNGWRNINESWRDFKTLIFFIYKFYKQKLTTSLVSAFGKIDANHGPLT